MSLFNNFKGIEGVVFHGINSLNPEMKDEKFVDGVNDVSDNFKHLFKHYENEFEKLVDVKLLLENFEEDIKKDAPDLILLKELVFQGIESFNVLNDLLSKDFPGLRIKIKKKFDVKAGNVFLSYEEKVEVFELLQKIIGVIKTFSDCVNTLAEAEESNIKKLKSLLLKKIGKITIIKKNLKEAEKDVNKVKTLEKKLEKVSFA